jgi:hypothetical protein
LENKRTIKNNGKRSGRGIITTRGSISLETYRRFSTFGHFEIKRKHRIAKVLFKRDTRYKPYIKCSYLSKLKKEKGIHIVYFGQFLLVLVGFFRAMEISKLKFCFWHFVSEFLRLHCNDVCF